MFRLSYSGLKSKRGTQNGVPRRLSLEQTCCMLSSTLGGGHFTPAPKGWKNKTERTILRGTFCMPQIPFTEWQFGDKSVAELPFGHLGKVSQMAEW